VKSQEGLPVVPKQGTCCLEREVRDRQADEHKEDNDVGHDGNTCQSVVPLQAISLLTTHHVVKEHEIQMYADVESQDGGVLELDTADRSLTDDEEEVSEHEEDDFEADYFSEAQLARSQHLDLFFGLFKHVIEERQQDESHKRHHCK